MGECAQACLGQLTCIGQHIVCPPDYSCLIYCKDSKSCEDVIIDCPATCEQDPPDLVNCDKSCECNSC
jgi:hypothetical protein